MRARLSILAAAVAVAALAHGGSAAAPKPQIVDPAGDALGAQGTTDITSAVWSTTGTTSVSKVRGKKVTTYRPSKLVVTLNLAAAPSRSAPFSYEASAEVAGCGEVRFTYTPGTVFSTVLGESSLWIDCGPTDPTTGDNLLLIAGVSTNFTGNSISWSIGIKTMPKPVQVGSKWSGFRASADLIDPVFGLYGTRDIQSIDVGTGNGTWVLG